MNTDRERYRFHVKHVRQEARHRELHEVMFYGERLGAIVVTDEVASTFPSYPDLQHAVEMAIRHLVLGAAARYDHEEDLKPWTA